VEGEACPSRSLSFAIFMNVHHSIFELHLLRIAKFAFQSSTGILPVFPGRPARIGIIPRTRNKLRYYKLNHPQG
jgi:hypothetical protein